MKVTIYPRIGPAKLRHVVPPAYRDAAASLAVAPTDVASTGIADVAYSVLLFAHTPRDVVPSAPVRKALRRLGEPAPGGVVAVGTVFTAEALELLREAGAQVLALRRAPWTDASARGRQL